MPLPQNDTDLVGALLGTSPGPGTPANPSPGPAKEAASEKSAEIEGKPPVEEAEKEELDPMVQALLDQEKEEEESEGEESAQSEQGADAILSEENLGRVATAFGVDPEELVLQDGQLRIRTKIDGEVSEASLLDLRKGYQKDSSLTRKQQQFLQQKEEWEKAQETQKQQLTQTAQILGAVAQKDFADLHEKFKKTNWEELRGSDPAEYSARIAEFQHKEAQIKQRYAEAAQFLQKQQQENAEKARTHYEGVVESEHKKLREVLGWSDDKAAETGGAEIEAYLTGQAGFTAQEMSHFVDHRAAVIADKARQWDLLQARVAAAKAKVKEVKDTAKAPGGQSQVGKPTNLTELKKRAKNSGRVDSPEALSYLLAASKKAR